MMAVRSFSNSEHRQDLVCQTGGDEVVGTLFEDITRNPTKDFVVLTKCPNGEQMAAGLCNWTCENQQVFVLFPDPDSTHRVSDVMPPQVTKVVALHGERVNPPMLPHVLRQEQIIMGTSGKLLDLLRKKKVIDPNMVSMLVIYEADLVINQQGGHDQTVRIIKELPGSCQKVLFCTTWSEEMVRFADTVTSNDIRLVLSGKHFYVDCHNEEDMFRALTYLCERASIEQAMVVCNTPQLAQSLADKMAHVGKSVALITEESFIVPNRFHENLLITTNLSTFIDVPVVINCNVSPDWRDYLQKAGCTARFGEAGRVINLMEGEHSMQHFRKLEEHFVKKMTQLDVNNPGQTI